MLEIVLITLALLAAIAAAIGVWRTPPAAPPPDFEPLLKRLEETERRLADELSRVREANERGVREAADAQARALAEARTALAEAQGGKLDAFAKVQADTLQAARAAQDQRLDALRETIGALQANLLELARAQSEKSAAAAASLQEKITASLTALGEKLSEGQSLARRDQTESLSKFGERQQELGAAQSKAMADLQAALAKRFEEMREAQARLFAELQEQVRATLEKLRADNEQKLEKMRATVDEKLQATLETRLGQSFKQVSERLEQVHKGLGEMQTLASGVGDLKRVLTNVRSRGTFGEVQLGVLLEQVLTTGQYVANVATVPGSSERVEFAIRLPGRDDDGAVVLLPIDAKFPQEDYLRLQEAFEAGDAAGMDAARKALRTRLMTEGQKIRDKYISPPHTTDFAILFVPTEGLFAEALRLDGLVEELQKRHTVTLAGPTTLYALLNSLSMGFRTLAIEKRSSEVWKVLGAVKTEFGKFGDSLDAVSKKLSEASSKIDYAAQRSRVMERKLKGVESLPADEARALLPEAEAEPDE